MPTKAQAPEPVDVCTKFMVVNYADYLYSYACTRIDDNDIARDLVQETFLAALEGWENLIGVVQRRPGLRPY